MPEQRNRLRSIGAAVVVLSVSGLVTSCTDPTTQPAQQVSQVSDSAILPKDAGSLVTRGPVVQPPSKPNYIVVARGQSLSQIAHSHRVTPAALAAANNLQPPYKLNIGSRLILPNLGPPPIQQANVSNAAPAPSPLPTPPPLPVRSEDTAAMAPQPVPHSAAQLGPSKESATPQPLQVQAPAALALPRAPPVLAPRNPAAALPLPGEAP